MKATTICLDIIISFDYTTKDENPAPQKGHKSNYPCDHRPSWYMGQYVTAQQANPCK